MKKTLLCLLASLSTSGLFADATLSVATILPEALEVQIDGYSYFAGTNNITIPNIYSGYHRVVVYGAASQLFNQDMLLQDGIHTDITINRFGTATVDERTFAYPVIEILPMSYFEFSQALSALNAEWFADSRMSLAEQIIDLHYLTSDQVGQIMQLFTFDEDRLTIAKMAFAKTVDPQNYYLLNQLFMFSSSKEDLATFIRFS